MATPLGTPCSREFYKAAHFSGPRHLSEIRWIVLHSEEATTARSAAAWFKNPKSAGSAHISVDDNECYRSLANEDVPWGAPGANEKGFHIEQAGFARWSAAEWVKHTNTIRRAAYKAALHCKQFDIPIVFVKADGLKKGWAGITTHRECSKAFGGTHTDPGAFYPVSMFMFFCRRYRKQLG